MKIDHLFFMTTSELLKLSAFELKAKKARALLLAKCLQSVIRMKKETNQ